MEMSWYWWSLSYVEVNLGIKGLKWINEVTEWGREEGILKIDLRLIDLDWVDEVRKYYIKVKYIIWNVKINEWYNKLIE